MTIGLGTSGRDPIVQLVPAVGAACPDRADPDYILRAMTRWRNPIGSQPGSAGWQERHPRSRA